jgi:hypothetical protein
VVDGLECVRPVERRQASLGVQSERRANRIGRGLVKPLSSRLVAS